MEANWDTVYREGCIASDAASVISPLWINAESGSESEAILQSIRDYLYDRADVCWAFCEIVSARSLPPEQIEECDIPF